MSKKKMLCYKSITEIKRLNETTGHGFFARGARKFFDSKVERKVYGGRFFITSERCHNSDGSSCPRKWTIRTAMADGSIRTIGSFSVLPTLRMARRFIQCFLDGMKVCPFPLKGEAYQVWKALLEERQVEEAR